ncbi:MAG: hypothetical protein R3Y28_08715 [Candidatus Gastranaerophilales bacterium]
MKIIFKLLKNLLLFVLTTFIAGFTLLVCVVIYECLTIPNHIFSNIESEENSFFIINSSEEVFDVEILFGEKLLYKKELNANSKDFFVYNISSDNDYQVKYKIGDKEGSVLSPASIYSRKYYYILATSSKELIFENVYLEKGVK